MGRSGYYKLVAEMPEEKKKSDDLKKQGFGQISRRDFLKEEEYGRTLPAMDLENTGIR
jgi:hypothetical protein